MRNRIRDFVNPGSGIQDGKSRIRDRDKHPGSATLHLSKVALVIAERQNFKSN
jgi:hypothetical protein